MGAAPRRRGGGVLPDQQAFGGLPNAMLAFSNLRCLYCSVSGTFLPINRNYRRVERYELKLGDEKQGKDLSYNDYADWLRELHTAKVAFMSGEMSEEEFREAIHMLDHCTNDRQ